MATMSEWISGARPRTLPAAAAPVLIGAGAAAHINAYSPTLTLLALAVAFALQIGVNYANDYSDGVRGTDLDRVGPLRLTASGAAPAHTVKRAAFLALGVGAALGLVILALTGHWWLGIVGLAAIAAAWFYTGGRRPYGYAGYGEVGVFVFFGLVATLGTQYIQADTVTWPGALGAVGVGLIACALLMVNNIRDIPTDHLAGKHTLAVKLGEHRARSTYVAMIWLPLIIAVIQGFWVPWTFLTLLLLVPATMLALAVRVGARGKLLIPVLAGTGLYELGYGILFGGALALAGS